jgi:hypothetical protein
MFVKVTIGSVPEVAKDKYSDAMVPFRSNVFLKLLIGACGFYPRELLDPVGSLMHAILTHTIALEAEAICFNALQSENLQLEESVKDILLLVFKRCAQGTIRASKIMDMLDDIWFLCQKDGIGGDAIQAFVMKYS